MQHKSKSVLPPSSPVEDNKQSSPGSPHDDYENEAPPTKKQKRGPAVTGASVITVSKKGKACIACRKLKVKCDSADRGPPGCSRCQRLGLECVNVKRPSVNSEDGETHPSIIRLDQAVEDILQKLKMPALETYSKSSVVDSAATVKAAPDLQITRDNSREPVDANDITPAPMGSLYEATRLNSLRSRLHRAMPGQRSARRSAEHDMVAQRLISLKDAEEMFELFKKSLARYLFAATIPEDTVLRAVRESSTLLFTAIMLVSALHIPGKETVHQICHKQFLELVATSMFEPFHTLDDVRGLCIAAFWQPDLSWKLSGLCIRMATELNLHQAYYTAFYIHSITEGQREIALEKARVWYLLYVLDHHFSIAYGRPPVTAELLPIGEYDIFVNSPWCTSSDRRLISQVSIFVILSKAFEIFGLEAERVMDGNEATLSEHVKFVDDIRIWRHRWENLLQSDKFIADYPSRGVVLHYHFSSLVLNSLALRGRSLETLSTLPQSLRAMACNAIEAAHSILQFFLDEASYRDSLVGIPLYLHSMIAFAVVFLIKMSHHWHAIDVNIDPEARTRPLIEDIISTLRQCKASTNHMVYNMATGFERMLSTNWGESTTLYSRSNTKQGQKQPVRDCYRSGSYAFNQGKENFQPVGANRLIENYESHRHVQSKLNQPTQQGVRGGNEFRSTLSSPTTTGYDHNQQQPMTQQGVAFEINNNMYDMGLDYDLLWSAGMGYDLLHPNRHDFVLGDLGLDSGFFDASADAETVIGASQKMARRGDDTSMSGLP